jgi:hypothetical protein
LHSGCGIQYSATGQLEVNIPLIPGYASGMSATHEELHLIVEQVPAERVEDLRRILQRSPTKEELHTLVDEVHADKAEYVLGLLKAVTKPPGPPRPNGDAEREYKEQIRQHLDRACNRVGLDVERLPQNGTCGAGINGELVEVDKDWVSEGARHRLRKIYVQGMK